MHRKWRGLALVLVLLISLGGNIVIYRKARQYYLQLNAARLDPLGASAYQSQAEEQNADGRPTDGRPLVVFFGDSRAYSWPDPQLSNFHFVNRGIGAQTSAQVAGRYDEHIQPLQPDVLVVQVGINDLKTIPLFPDQKEAIIADCKANIQEIVTKATTSGLTVLVITHIL